jgi:predicted nucleic acid-binding Zn ribbon protein
LRLNQTKETLPPIIILPWDHQSFLPIHYLRPMGQYSIGDAIKQFLNQSRMKGSIQALQIEDVWESIMGKTIARYTDNLKVINKTLFITTNVAPLKQELLYQKEKIKLRVNEALGDKVIEDIVIQ